MRRRIRRICGLAVVTALFILGNRLAAEGLFKNMENRLLSDMGSLKIETAVELDDVKPSDSDLVSHTDSAASESEQAKLTEEEMAEILTCWKYGGAEVIHEPMEGQFSMEAAIEKGKLWISKMLENGSMPDALYELMSDSGDELMFESVVAMLFTGYPYYEMPETLDPRYSGWSVTFQWEFGVIYLQLNAVTGEVWSADMTIYGEPEKLYMQLEKEDLEKFGQLAGIHAEDGFFYESGNTESILVGETGLTYVKGSFQFEEGASKVYSYAFGYDKVSLGYGADASCCRLQYVLCAADDESTEAVAGD